MLYGRRRNLDCPWKYGKPHYTGPPGVIQPEPTMAFKADYIFGSIEINDWFEPKGRKMVGMSRRTCRDKDGNIVDETVVPTGISVVFK